jgi:hypothetical protein
MTFLTFAVPLALGFRLRAIWRELPQSFPLFALKTNLAVNSIPRGYHDGRSIKETFLENKVQWYCPRTRVYQRHNSAVLTSPEKPVGRQILGVVGGIPTPPRRGKPRLYRKMAVGFY